MALKRAFCSLKVGHGSGVDGHWLHSKLSHVVFQSLNFICTLTGILIVHVAESFHSTKSEPQSVAILAPVVLGCSIIAGLQFLDQVVEQENLSAGILKLLVLLQDEVLDLLSIFHIGRAGLFSLYYADVEIREHTDGFESGCLIYTGD